MKLFEKYPRLKPFAFALACGMVYGGSVNLGAFDFFPATPFLVFVLYAAWKWKKGYAIACVLLAMVCVPLYVLKGRHDSLFHPALGMEFRTAEETCLTLYRNSGDDFVLMSKLIQNKCDSSNMGDAIRWEILPKGSKLTIKRISVSHADFSEHYVIHSTVPLGEISLFDLDRISLEWLDGHPVKESDLRRGIFHYPSLLMYWAVAPILIPTLFSGIFR